MLSLSKHLYHAVGITNPSGVVEMLRRLSMTDAFC